MLLRSFRFGILILRQRAAVQRRFAAALRSGAAKQRATNQPHGGFVDDTASNAEADDGFGGPAQGPTLCVTVAAAWVQARCQAVGETWEARRGGLSCLLERWPGFVDSSAATSAQW
jgi:hypothetical protein